MQVVAFAGATSREVLMSTTPDRNSQRRKIGANEGTVDPVFTKSLRQAGRDEHRGRIRCSPGEER
jgi:hypothetical protein